MKRSKKGEESAVTAWGTIAMVVYLIYVSIVAVLLIYGMMSFKNNTVGIPDSVTTRVIFSRFLMAEDCLAYKDSSIARTDGYVMDWQHFENNDFLRKCYSQIKGDLSFRLTIEKHSNKDEGRTITTSLYRDAQLPLVKIIRPIIIRDGNQIVDGRLTVEVQQ
ncbi:MAG: hypothetical protein AABX51_00880 [Nanoarchaeota archaeon]